MTAPSSGDVIELVAEGGFNIRSAAKQLSLAMEENNLPLLIHLPHVSVEFEPGCTPKEIIDGYHFAMKQITATPSNTNQKKKK